MLHFKMSAHSECPQRHSAASPFSPKSSLIGLILCVWDTGGEFAEFIFGWVRTSLEFEYWGYTLYLLHFLLLWPKCLKSSSLRKVGSGSSSRRIQPIIVRKADQHEHPVRSQGIHSHEAERQQEVGWNYKAWRPTPLTHFLQGASSS